MDAPVYGPLPAKLSPLFTEIVELKRVRSAQSAGRSLADVGFRRAWARFVAGEDVGAVADTELAFALAHVALGPVDGRQLAEAGLAPEERRTVFRRAASRGLNPLDPQLERALDGLADGAPHPTHVPRFVDLLCDQPRAGAVSEGTPRLVMTPEEMHSEHCWSTAVIGGLIQLARREEAAPAVLLGLVHHAHNAYLSDGGFAAEMLLEDHLGGILSRCAERALGELPEPLADACRGLLAHKDSLSGSLGTAFNAADVIDRVVQQRHYANLAGFSLSDALDERELVHPGPLQAYQVAVLEHMGLRF